MSSIKIYDSEGRLYRDGTATNDVDEEISNYFTSGIRLAVKTGRRYTITVFFRAAESSASRSEQFYASYTVRNVREIDQLADEVERVVEDQWGYSVDRSSNDMEVYRQLAAGEYTVPDDDISKTLLEEVLQQRRTATVGVENASKAIGLVFSMESSFDSAAIATSSSGNAFTSFDLVTTIGRYSGIEPVGNTAEAWDQARSQVRDNVLNSKIASIQSDVNELSSTWGYDDETIRQEVTRRVPALSAPTTYDSGGSSSDSGSLGSGSLGSGSLGGSSSNDDLKKYLAIALIAISVIGIILVGVTMLPDDGEGSGNEGDMTETPTETATSYISLLPSAVGSTQSVVGGDATTLSWKHAAFSVAHRGELRIPLRG